MFSVSESVTSVFSAVSVILGDWVVIVTGGTRDNCWAEEADVAVIVIMLSQHSQLNGGTASASGRHPAAVIGA